MTKPRRIAFVILLVCILGGLAWTVLRRPKVPNPVYNGKKLSQLLDEGPSSPKAAEAVREMGTNCVPFLLWELGFTRDSRIKSYVIALQKKILPGKFWMRSSGERWSAAVVWLRGLRDVAVPAATDGLTNSDKQIRLGSEVALLFVHTNSPKITRLLLEKLEDPDLMVRSQAALTLANVDQDEPEIVLPVLMKLLDQKEKRMQRAAISALGVLGPKAKPAIPKLLEMRSKINSGKTYELFMLEDSIKKIDPQAAANAGIK